MNGESFIEEFKKEGNYLLLGLCGIGKFKLAVEVAKKYAREYDILSVPACKIEHVREVIKFVNNKPFSSEFKIVVLCVDAISNSAAQALLKVLEETPNKSRFILTGNIDLGIPETIISRCKLIEIKPLKEYDLMIKYNKLYNEIVPLNKAAYAGGSLEKLKELMQIDNVLTNIMSYISMLSKGKIERIYALVKGWGDLEVKYFRVLLENILVMSVSDKVLYSKDDLIFARGVIFNPDKVLNWLDLNLKASLKFIYIGIRCNERK